MGKVNSKITELRCLINFSVYDQKLDHVLLALKKFNNEPKKFRIYVHFAINFDGK